MSQSVQEIRERINARHQRALEALAEIEKFLEEENDQVLSQHLANGAATEPMPRKNRSHRQGRSNRDLVESVVDGQWASVAKISEQTGLDRKKVRGVLYAPILKGNFDKRVGAEGDVEYRLQSPEIP